jgi:hypothetical protein
MKPLFRQMDKWVIGGGNGYSGKRRERGTNSLLGGIVGYGTYL